MIDATEADFNSLGLTSDDWKALLFGSGSVPLERMTKARAAIARIGRHTEAQARDTDAADYALKLVAITYPRRCFPGPFTHEETLKFVQLREGCSRDEAERKLEAVQVDNAEVARIQQKGK
jgi:hypothetical protein